MPSTSTLVDSIYTRRVSAGECYPPDLVKSLFVISGFVITSVVLRDLAAGKFSLREFWIRRARRIIPPLIPVLLVSLAIGWVLLMPGEFLKFGTSLASQAIFGSNFHFLHNSSYFAAPAQTKLLLHTWSLSVEEQFYVVYPLVLLALMRLHRPIWLLGLLLLVSLGVSIQLSLSNPAAAFYLPHSRAWELLLGAAIAFYVAHEHHWHPPHWLRELLALGGLISMLVAMTWFDHNTRFPGAAALLPCLGAAAFIYANTHTHTYVGRVFSIRPVLYLGLASYALAAAGVRPSNAVWAGSMGCGTDGLPAVSPFLPFTGRPDQKATHVCLQQNRDPTGTGFDDRGRGCRQGNRHRQRRVGAFLTQSGGTLHRVATQVPGMQSPKKGQIRRCLPA